MYRTDRPVQHADLRRGTRDIHRASSDRHGRAVGDRRLPQCRPDTRTTCHLGRRPGGAYSHQTLTGAPTRAGWVCRFGSLSRQTGRRVTVAGVWGEFLTCLGHGGRLLRTREFVTWLVAPRTRDVGVCQLARRGCKESTVRQETRSDSVQKQVREKQSRVTALANNPF